jgi:hypothetical protein
VSIGVDVGQRVDPTAIVVGDEDRRDTEDGRGVTHYVVRHLERLPLGTSYPQVVARLRAIAAGVAAHTAVRPALYVDATGVGTPLLDLLRAARVEAEVVGCWFTCGSHRTYAQREVRIGKAWLVSRLQTLVQTGCLHLPHSPEAEALTQELLDYQIRVDPDRDAKFGAFSTGTHDDLVTALGLACQGDPRPGAGWTAYIERDLARRRGRAE